MQHHVGLDRLHLLERNEAIATLKELAQTLFDARDAEAGLPRVSRVGDPAAWPQLVERIVVARHAGGIVVGVDEIAGRRIDDLRHLGERQHFECARLIRLAIRCRQPLVAALAIAHEPGRHAVHRSGPQILAHRNLAGREVGDIAVHIDIDEVLRANVEALQRTLEIVDIAGAVEKQKRLDLLRWPIADVLNAERSAGRGIERNDRPEVASRHDQRRRRNAGGRRDDDQGAAHIGAERL